MVKRVTWISSTLVLVSTAILGHGCDDRGGGSGGAMSAGSSGSSTLSASGSGGGGTGGAEAGGGGSPPQCDPFTGVPCDVDGGEACDIDWSGFTCFPGPSGATLCDPCGVDAPDGGAADWCDVGMTCVDSNRCAAFCCDDGDCGSGVCDKDSLGDPDVGVCVAGGDGGALTEPACDAPKAPPSGGSCYTSP
jgi:hypothetical protein